MQKKSKGMILVLALTGLFLPFLSQGARAQGLADIAHQETIIQWLTQIYDYLSQQQYTVLQEILWSIEGQNPGTPPYATYNTNFLLGGGMAATSTRNVIQALYGPTSHDQGGSTTNYQPATQTNATVAVPPASNLYDPDTYNDNSLLQNALMGWSGAGDSGLTKQATYPNGVVAAASGNVLGVSLPDSTTAITADQVVSGQRALNDARAQTTFPDAKGAVPKTMESEYMRAWAFRCKNGFNPTDNSPEGILNAQTIGKNAGCAAQNTAYVRADRSMESLLNPLQYQSPPDMAIPLTGAIFVRFTQTVTQAGANYYPIYEAAGFCQNVSLKAYPESDPIKPFPKGSSDVTNWAIASEKVWRESVDGKVVGNCWHFFEERIQYPANTLPHAQQENRCKNDFQNLHIISSYAYQMCQQLGRSSLQARADMAYRLDSQEYISYLNTLGVTTRELLYAQALADQERFEQSLLLERQIMTEALNLPDRPSMADVVQSSGVAVQH